MARRWVHGAVAMAVLAVVGVGCAGGSGETVEVGSSPGGAATSAPERSDVTEAPHPKMTEEDIPDEAKVPFQTGDGSARSFKALLDASVQQLGDKRVPLPDTLPLLFQGTDQVVHGTVTGVELVPATRSLGPGMDMATISVRLSLDVDAAYKTGGKAEPTVWVQELWAGDPVLAETELAKAQAELGDGPIGAEVVLFGFVPAGSDGAELAALDGLIADAGGTYRVAPAAEGQGAHLTSIDQVVAELRRLPPQG